MADEFGQRIQGLHVEGDTPVATDKHIAVFALDDSGDYAYLNLDASGNLKVSSSGGAGSTQYDVGDAAGATDTGTLSLVVRDDALTTLADADGDYVQMRVNSTGALWVTMDGDVNVTATDLDIRDLDGATDTVNLNDGTNSLVIDSSGFVTANINGDVNVTQGTDPWVIGDGGNSITVDAVDLDIRDLVSATDEVGIGDGTNSLVVNGDGSLNVVSSESALDSTYTYGSSNLVKDTEATVVTRAAAADEGYSGVMVSGAGYCEWKVYFGTTSSEAVILSFWTTPSNPTQFVDLPDYLEVSSGETIYISGTNREKKGSPNSDFTGHASLIRKI